MKKRRVLKRRRNGGSDYDDADDDEDEGAAGEGEGGLTRGGLARLDKKSKAGTNGRQSRRHRNDLKERDNSSGSGNVVGAEEGVADGLRSISNALNNTSAAKGISRELILLNVRGRSMDVLQQTVRLADKGSVLFNMFCGSMKAHTRDGFNRIFIDRNPVVFELLIDHLTGVDVTTRFVLRREADALHQEACYWGLLDLVQRIEELPDREEDRGDYVGQMRGVERHGLGKMTWPNGDTYVGSWSDDVRHDIGRFIQRNLDEGGGESAQQTYDGSWEDDMPHGKGTERVKGGEVLDEDGHTCDIIDPSMYVGDFVRGKKHGIGKMTWKRYLPDFLMEEDVYEGSWEQGYASGHGVMRFGDGSVYEGSFCRPPVQVGYGSQVFPGRSWQHGQGRVTWADGRAFTGTWVRGSMSHGRMVWPSGDCYEGHFLNDVMHGRDGVYTFGDGRRPLTGTWMHNHHVT